MEPAIALLPMRTPRRRTSPTMTERTMNERQFGPVKSGSEIPAPQRSAGIHKKRERRPNGPQEALKGNIENTFDVNNNTGKIPESQAYLIRWLRRRYRLSRNYAAFVAAKFRWEGA